MGVIRIPADGGGVNEEFGPGKRHQPGCFRVPLVPADQYPEPADRCVDRGEIRIARGEVEFLIVRRIIRDVHLAIFAGNGTIPVKDHRGIMVESRRAPLKQGSDYNHPEFFRHPAEYLRGRSGDGLRLVKISGVFALAKVEAGMKLLKNYQVGAHGAGRADALDTLGQVDIPVFIATLLHETNGQCVHEVTPFAVISGLSSLSAVAW